MQPSPSAQDKSLTNASPRFVFKITINPHGEDHPGLGYAPLGGRSVVVEVEPEETIGAFRFGFPTRTAWRIAEEVAQGAALQTVQKDFPHGFEPACQAAPLEGLPDELRHRHPISHTRQARSWLV